MGIIDLITVIIPILPFIVIVYFMYTFGVFDLLKSFKSGKDGLAGSIAKKAVSGTVKAAGQAFNGATSAVAAELPKAKYRGQSCSTHADCYQWKPATPGSLACCDGKCTPMKRDWAGVGYCPSQCRGGAFMGAGTC